MFMNDYDISMARRWIQNEGDWFNTLELIDVLERLVEWANNNSDGWHSWPKPARAARQLMERVHEQENKARMSLPQVDITPQVRDAALRPIKAFLTRQSVPVEDRRWILEGPRAS